MSVQNSIKKVNVLLKGIISKLKGGDKRRAAAEVAREYGSGGQRYVAREFNIGRNTLRKGTNEIESGKNIEDRYSARGRKKKTDELPKLEGQIKSILDGQSQTDPKFQTNRLYTKMSIFELQKELIKRFGYTSEELPSLRTLNTITNNMGYTVKSVRKSKPIKKIKETELIFENLNRVHELASENENIIRLSIDAKDKVKIGNFSRGGKSRLNVEAYDHDFGNTYLTPFGIMDVKNKKVDISLGPTKVTADYIVDRIDEYWLMNGYSGTGKTLLLNADNGPENNGRRTQFIKRMIEFSIDHNTPVILAYYPPYHSKYNPIERVWGVLEQHWNGGLLDTGEAVEGYIKTMTYNGIHPKVQVIDKIYETGIKVVDKLMETYEQVIERIAGLEKWFIRISPRECMERLAFTGCFY